MNNKAEYTPEKVVDISNLSREDWLEYRKKGIGGSDVAAIMGISPFATIGNEFVKMIFVSFLNSNIYPLKNLPTSRVCIFLETPYSKASSHFPIASHLQ